jgi:hypothetical protein
MQGSSVWGSRRFPFGFKHVNDVFDPTALTRPSATQVTPLNRPSATQVTPLNRPSATQVTPLNRPSLYNARFLGLIPVNGDDRDFDAVAKSQLVIQISHCWQTVGERGGIDESWLNPETLNVPVDDCRYGRYR